MKFFGITSAFIVALVTITSAVPTQIANDPDITQFYITEPLNNKVYSAGGVITTEWINGKPGPFTLELLKGNKAASMQDTGIPFKNTDGNTGSYKWQVPSDMPAGIYAFHYVFNGGESYSPRFKITTGNTDSNTQQQHTESTQPRVNSDTASNGSNIRPNTGSSYVPPSLNPNGASNTRDQLPPQGVAGKPDTTGSLSTLSETSDRVPQQVSQQRQPLEPQQKVSQQRQPLEPQAKTDNETGRS